MALVLVCAGAAAPAADDASTPSPVDLPVPEDLVLEGPEADVATLRDTAERDPRALGPLSIGTPDAGLLLNPVLFPEGSYWTLREPDDAWATDETIDFIMNAIEAVEARYPRSPPLVIGDLSHPRGGRIDRHRSHQAGRDADLGFYYRSGEST